MQITMTPPAAGPVSTANTHPLRLIAALGATTTTTAALRAGDGVLLASAAGLVLVSIAAEVPRGQPPARGGLHPFPEHRSGPPPPSRRGARGSPRAPTMPRRPPPHTAAAAARASSTPRPPMALASTVAAALRALAALSASGAQADSERPADLLAPAILRPLVEAHRHVILSNVKHLPKLVDAPHADTAPQVPLTI